VLCGVGIAHAAVEIIDLPATLDPAYDLTTTLGVSGHPSRSLTVTLTGAGTLTLMPRYVRWVSVGTDKPTTVRKRVAVGASTAFSLKRRPETLAVVLNHRLIFAVPAVSHSSEHLIVRTVPTGWHLNPIRYRVVAPHRFGDDFMRPGTLERYLAAAGRWVDDPEWSVAWYDHQPDPTAHCQQMNPWLLSLFPNTQTTANAFWMLYTGAGPSWIVANPTLVFPSWDRYFVEAAAKTDAAGGEIGLIAAYQDPRNYLLFRWRQHDSQPLTAPRAELIAVIDGMPTQLAASNVVAAPEQWYTLRVNLGWHQVQALVDGTVLLQAANPGLIEGRIGLFACGMTAVAPDTSQASLPTDPTLATVARAEQDAHETASCLAFDDVRVGDWVGVDAFTASPYPGTVTGRWKIHNGELQAKSPGRQVTGASTWGRYQMSGMIQVPAHGQAGILFHHTAQTEYRWMFSSHGQQLQVRDRHHPVKTVESSPVRLVPGQWAVFRVEADGPYVALFVNEHRVMDHYDLAQTKGQCGVVAQTAGVAFRDLAVTQSESRPDVMTLPTLFTSDPWIATWSSAEADWYPAVLPAQCTTPGGRPHSEMGAAAPFPTDIPGLYWHKMDVYGDFTVCIPCTATVLAGQQMHLAPGNDPAKGYSVRLDRATNGTAVCCLLRQGTPVTRVRGAVPPHARWCITRRGSYLLVSLQTLDPDVPTDDAAVLGERIVLTYRDSHPLTASHVGFTVTDPHLPAARLIIHSTAYRDTFACAPTEWVRGSGVWTVMARYTCDDRWNWFGGFGLGTPAVWSKTYLDGDQTVDAYLGIKMFAEEDWEAYALRFRDLAVSICTDGRHPESGYTLVRNVMRNGRPVTELRRCGVVVWRNAAPEALLPPKSTGHRQWFATRLEKHGATLYVYLDNRCVTQYVDPHPLPGGYVGIWTRDNGVMIGRVNLAAQQMRHRPL